MSRKYLVEFNVHVERLDKKAKCCALARFGQLIQGKYRQFHKEFLPHIRYEVGCEGKFWEIRMAATNFDAADVVKHIDEVDLDETVYSHTFPSEVWKL